MGVGARVVNGDGDGVEGGMGINGGVQSRGTHPVAFPHPFGGSDVRVGVGVGCSEGWGYPFLGCLIYKKLTVEYKDPQASQWEESKARTSSRGGPWRGLGKARGICTPGLCTGIVPEMLGGKGASGRGRGIDGQWWGEGRGGAPDDHASRAGRCSNNPSRRCNIS